MIKNAIAYITRKKNRTFIIFVILTIVLSCLYSCLTIMKSSNEIEKTLYESSNSSISITKKDGKYFNVNQFKDIEKLKEIEEIIIQYDGLAKLKGAKVVSGEQKINREDLSDKFKNVVSLEATNNTKRNILFNSEVFTINRCRTGVHTSRHHNGSCFSLFLACHKLGKCLCASGSLHSYNQTAAKEKRHIHLDIFRVTKHGI